MTDTARLSVTVDGVNVFDRDVTKMSTSENADGSFTLHADFPAINLNGAASRGMVFDGDIDPARSTTPELDKNDGLIDG